VGSPSGVFAGAVAEDPTRVDELLRWMRGVQSRQPGMLTFTNQASLFGRGIGGGRNIEVHISGSDLGTLTAVARDMFARTREALEGAQVRPVPSLGDGAPELHAVPRRDEASALGIDAAELGTVVNAFADGAIVGELGPDGTTQVNVVIRARNRAGDLLEDPHALESAPIRTPGGSIVPLAVLARFDEQLGPTIVQRIERRRAVTLRVVPPEEVPLEDAIATIETDVVLAMESADAIPRGVDVALAGTASDLDEAKADFAGVLLLALIISFLLMAALFEDFLAPLVVLASVPLAAAGGVLGLRLVDATIAPQPLDLMTALGFLILIGVVVNNAILVVDGAIARLRAGVSLTDAVPQAVEDRVRPIFMTTATSLAGLLPMVLFSGAGSELYRGVGAIVLGGLALSSLLTLFVVPSLFSLVWRVRLSFGATRSS
ncbi:MAG: efflux RND transporter permease subunit, partial [Myxococcota bacterium]